MKIAPSPFLKPPARETGQSIPTEGKASSTGHEPNLKVRLIDGAEFRNQSLEQQEFSLYATHYDFETIPEGEVWIDENVSEEDQKYFLINASEYVRTRKEGDDEDEAYDEGLSEERVERSFATEGGEGERPYHDEVFDGIYLEKLETLEQNDEEIEVWLVDGQKVREMMKTDFAEGGHGLVYPSIPEKEIWCEQAVPEEERPFVIKHEFTERGLMRQGVDYNDAHDQASKEEFAARQEKEEKSLPCCPNCGGQTKSDGEGVWCKSTPCDWHDKAMSAIAEGSGGALVAPAQQGWRCRKPPCRGGLHTSPPGEYKRIEALRKKYLCKSKKARTGDKIRGFYRSIFYGGESDFSGTVVNVRMEEAIRGSSTYGDVTIKLDAPITLGREVTDKLQVMVDERGNFVEDQHFHLKGNFNAAGPPATDLSDTRKPIERKIKSIQQDIQKAIQNLPAMPGYGFVLWNEEKGLAYISLGDSDGKKEYDQWKKVVGSVPGVKEVKADAEIGWNRRLYDKITPKEIRERDRSEEDKLRGTKDFSAYTNGQEAKQRNESRHSCPYPIGSANCEDWLKG